MYKTRLIEKNLDYYLNNFSAVLLEGAKGTGKTSTCSLFAKTIFELDDPTINEVVTNAPNIIIEADKPVLLDEWQYSTNLWNYIRHQVDKGLEKNSIILTGSSPRIDNKLHSGALRIARLKMRTFTIEERELSNDYIRIADLLDDKYKITGTTNMSIMDYLAEIYKSGFPSLRDENEKNRKIMLTNYVDYLVEHDFKLYGFDIRTPNTLKLWLKIYACSIATITAQSTINNIFINNNTITLSRETTNNYLNALNLLNIIEYVPQWTPLKNMFKNIGKTPKHFLIDGALALNLLDLSKDKLLNFKNYEEITKYKPTYIGQLFENFIFESLVVYAEINDAKLYHFRTSKGDHEIDFIIEKGNQLLLIEVKGKTLIGDADVKHFNWFESNVGDEYDIKKIIVYAGPMAYSRKDDVHVIPAALLGC